MLLFDLEDSVPVEQKQQAREGLAGVLQSLVSAEADIAVRVNRSLSACLLDLEAALVQGKGVIDVNGVMVDAPVYKRAKRRLEK